MHKIYLENRCIAICSEDDPAVADPNAIEFHPGPGGIKDLSSLFCAVGSLMHIYLPSRDPQALYEEFCSTFKEVNAAGGLVSNRRGDFLLIRRGDKWDLPKGHQESGEDISVTAIREVEEETGVSGLELKDLICVTDHCYFRGGMWHLKHTWWYDMRYTVPEELVPQTEEDITKAAWVARSSLPPYLKNTYPSILEVFRRLESGLVGKSSGL